MQMLLTQKKDKPDPEVIELVILINDSGIIGIKDWDQDYDSKGLLFMLYGVNKDDLVATKGTTLSIDLDKLAKNPSLVANHAL